MQINDLIEKYTDRLFIVAPECFIIFTGDSIQDKTPFIRIGNWVDLPLGIIPLIENIIITDNISGDPSLEQFNIDINHLEENKYIGNEKVLTNFLKFQKIFGLDLNNSVIVNVEKDVPELLEEKISSKDQFIGVFYRNGNFKILFDNKMIFDFFEIEDKSINSIKRFDLLSQSFKKTDNYDNPGVVILENNPLFFNKQLFISYMFPYDPLNDFFSLKINPGNINNIIYPSMNFTKLTDFLKWKNTKTNKVNIFTNFIEQIDVIQSLFNKLNIITKSISGVNIKTKGDIAVKNYKNGLNLIVKYNNSLEEIVICYINEKKNIHKIIKGNIDLIIIPFSLYKNLNLIFKGSNTPILVVDDGDGNIVKLSDKEVIRNRVRYFFEKYNEIEKIIKDSPVEEKIFNQLKEENFNVNEIKIEDKSDIRECIKNFNLQTSIKLLINSTKDRKKSIILNEIIDKKSSDVLFHSNYVLTVKIIIFENRLYQFIIDSEEIINEFYSEDLKFDVLYKYVDHLKMDMDSFYNRVLEDRERLNKIVDLFINKSSDEFLIDRVEKIKKINEIRSKIFIDNSPIVSDSLFFESDEIKKRGRLYVIILSGLFFLVLFFLLNNFYLSDKEVSPVAKTKVIEKVEVINSNIIIDKSDIFNYANKVALKNGYKKIKFSPLKLENPHWIYPGNKFEMLDNEIVLIEKGDFLLKICEKKLIKMDLEFMQILNRISKENKIADLLIKAEQLAFTKKNRAIILNLKKAYEKKGFNNYEN